MKYESTDIKLAHELDTKDELASFRDNFVIDDPNLIYLDGNSLGRLPKATAALMKDVVENAWGKRLIRGWNEDWIDTPSKIGAKIARLVGAKDEEIIVADSTSVNLFKLATAAIRNRPNRTKIVSDVLNFPSDLYILQGIIDLFDKKHELTLIPSMNNISITPQAVDAAVDENTALVCLTHVAFKSAFMYDIARVTETAHKAGALMLWDLCHSVGAIPIDLNGSNVDMAVGCTYKYLNGGPGSPAFLYVRRDLQEKLNQPMWGWFAAENPFDFALDFKHACDISRFRVGTPSILSMKAMEPAIDIVLEATVERLRKKSIKQSEYLIYLADAWLLPLGFSLGTPREVERRGSHVSLRHPEGYRICRALIEARPPNTRVIPDFRTPDNIRFGITPLYTTFTEIHQAMERLRMIVEGKIYEQYTMERSAVT